RVQATTALGFKWYICNMPATTRQQKFARLIQKEISEIFQQDKRGYLGNAFVTIADVQVSPDLSIARIYVSMMLQDDKAGVLRRIESHKKEIRRDLGNRIGKQVRIVPDLIFPIGRRSARFSSRTSAGISATLLSRSPTFRSAPT